MPVFRGQGTRYETWQQTTSTATQAAGTKIYSKILRNPTGVQVDTSATPFSLPVIEKATFVDLLIAKAADNGDPVQIDMDINGVAQRIGLSSDMILVSNLTRPRLLPIVANPGSSLAFWQVLLATGTTKTNVNYYLVGITPTGS